MKIKPRLLIADNDPADLKLLEELLALQGYDVIIATDGNEILEKCSNDQIDLVLVAESVPGINGFEVIKKIKTCKETSIIPAILTIPEGDNKKRTKGIESGCDDIISKPFDRNEISIRVYTLLQITHYRPLLNEKERFQYLLNHMEDGIVIFDKDLKITHMNQGAKELLMINRDNIPEDFLEYINTIFTVHYEGDLKNDLYEKSLSFDIERPETKGTKSLILSVRVSPVKNPMGELNNIMLLLTDVTEERKEDMMKQNFLDLVSHKLRTPITVIMGNTSLLQEGILGALSKEQSNIINSTLLESQKLQALVDRLLTFTTSSSQDLDLIKESVNIRDHLSSFADSVIKPEKDKKIELDIDQEDKDLVTNMNRIYFELIIENLIENAIKFNDKETVKINITIRKSPEGVKFSVSDNGPGIPPEDKKKIFDRFYQIEKYFTGNVEGAGLGLALVKRLINAYGGNVELDSERGKGSTFSFTLPS